MQHISVVSLALILNPLNQLMVRFLTRCMDIEGATILTAPLAPFEAFEAQNQQTGPRLMHTQTHALVIRLLVEVLITSE